MRLLRKILIVIFKILRGFFLCLVFVLILPLIIYEEIRNTIVLSNFRRRESGKSLLVCSAGRGWYELLINNVIPVLPDHYRVIWTGRTKRKNYGRAPEAFGCAHIFLETPYVVVVNRNTLESQSLKEVLQKYKDHPQKSEETRRMCAMIINQVEEKLRR